MSDARVELGPEGASRMDAAATFYEWCSATLMTMTMASLMVMTAVV